MTPTLASRTLGSMSEAQAAPLLRPFGSGSLLVVSASPPVQQTGFWGQEGRCRQDGTVGWYVRVREGVSEWQTEPCCRVCEEWPPCAPSSLPSLGPIKARVNCRKRDTERAYRTNRHTEAFRGQRHAEDVVPSIARITYVMSRLPLPFLWAPIHQ